MKLIVTEKPSVALTIAKVLGVSEKKNGYYENDKYIVSWCIGHLLTLAEPESYGEQYKDWSVLPIIPDYWNYTVKAATKGQYNILKKLMHDSRIGSIICATDAGREGELIFRHVYNMTKCSKPFKRLWVSSLEDSAILKGFSELKDGWEYDNLYNSALCRERADWLVGINATRFFTTLYNSRFPLSIGRVQTPTLAMIVERDEAIKNFIKEKYYTVEINCGEFTAESGKYTDLTEAKAVEQMCNIARATITKVDKSRKKSLPPKLYDLTALQRDANKVFGFSAQQTLEAAQRLYENKLSTYPRTDSRYITEDMENTVNSVISAVIEKTDFANGVDFRPDIKKVINNNGVSDHHAIIPTVNILECDFTTLMDTDRKILCLIASRLLSAVSSEYEYEHTDVSLSYKGINFTATGNAVVEYGYRDIERNFRASIKTEEETENEKSLPSGLKVEQEFAVTSKIVSHYTSPPKPYTEDTLLSAMEKAGNNEYDTDEVERKGLGTPATRAAIIETIIKRGYVEREKRSLISTSKGQALIQSIPENLKSAKLTAEWENKLVLISKGKANSTDFMNSIKDFVTDVISNTEVNAQLPDINKKEVIGVCPVCKSNIYEGKSNFYCSNKECNFVLWKNNKFFETKRKTITKSAAKALLEKGKIHYKDLYSPKTDKTYEADIVLEVNNGTAFFRLDFTKSLIK